MLWCGVTRALKSYYNLYQTATPRTAFERLFDQPLINIALESIAARYVDKIFGYSSISKERFHKTDDISTPFNWN